MKQYFLAVHHSPKTGTRPCGGLSTCLLEVSMGALIQDFRYGIRLLLKNPGITLITVLSIAIGVSANTTVFCWIESVILNPLPQAPRSEELVTLATRMKSGEFTPTSYADYRDLRDQNTTLTGLAAFEEKPLSFNTQGRTQRVWAMMVTGNYFDVLGMRPSRGTYFLPEHHADATGGAPVAVVSHDFWTSKLGGDPSIIGKSIRLNSQSLTVIGVAPERFHGTITGLSFDVWVPIMLKSKLIGGSTEWVTIRKWRALHAIGRLKTGVALTQAQSEIGLISARLSRSYPADNAGIGAELFPPAKAPYGAQYILAKLLNVLFWASLVVLLIVISNVVNLLLVRASAREKEISVRMALGAGKSRILRQLITESLVVAILSAALSISLAFWMSDLLKLFIPTSNIPVSLALKLDPTVLAFAVAMSIAASLASGILPALRCSSVEVNSALQASARTSSNREKQRVRTVLAASEVALALVALTAAGLFIQNLHNISLIHPGFDEDNVVLVGLSQSEPGHSVAEMTQFYRRLEDRIGAINGVRAVSYAEHVPLGLQEGSREDIDVEGYTPRAEESMSFFRNLVDGGYFSVMGIPLVAGRDFTSRDDHTSAPVGIVNETFAKRFFDGNNAIGRRISGWGTTITVVGVAKDSKYSEPTETARPYLYVPFRQFAGSDTEAVLHVAVSGSPESVLAAVQNEVSTSGTLAYAWYGMALKDYTGAARFKHQMAAALMSVLALTGLVLAALGIYGVISHSVSLRTSEIGIRMALGATNHGILKLVLLQGFRVALMGLAAGAVAAFALGRLLGTLLHGVDPMNPATLGAASLLLILTALLASGIPAYRAGRLNPISALRYG